MSKYLLFDLLKLQILAENRTRHFTAFLASNIPSVIISASSNTFYCLNTLFFLKISRESLQVLSELMNVQMRTVTEAL